MVREYTKKDQPALLKLFQLNTPKYFDMSEHAAYADYLEKEAENYFVMEDGDKITAAGGFNTGFDNGRTARLSWDIVHPDYHGKGLGSQLIKHRINLLKEQPEIEELEVRTTQKAHEFYNKLGFELDNVEKDYWVDGFDLYQMRMKLK